MDDFDFRRAAAVAASYRDHKSEQALLKNLYELTLKVLSGISGREVEELKESISNLDKALDNKIEAARNIITTSITNLASKIWNSKPRKKAQAFIGATAKCFSAMGAAIKKNCGQAFQTVSDRFTEFAKQLPSLAKAMKDKAQTSRPESWVENLAATTSNSLTDQRLRRRKPKPGPLLKSLQPSKNHSDHKRRGPL